MDLKSMILGGAGEEQAVEQRLSKEEYAAMKKQQREEGWAEVDVQAQAVFQNGESLKGFLEKRTPFPKSWGAWLHLYGQHRI